MFRICSRGILCVFWVGSDAVPVSTGSVILQGFDKNPSYFCHIFSGYSRMYRDKFYILTPLAEPSHEFQPLKGKTSDHPSPYLIVEFLLLLPPPHVPVPSGLDPSFTPFTWQEVNKHNLSSAKTTNKQLTCVGYAVAWNFPSFKETKKAGQRILTSLQQASIYADVFRSIKLLIQKLPLDQNISSFIEYNTWIHEMI